MNRNEVITALNNYIQAAETFILSSQPKKVEQLNEVKKLAVHCYSINSVMLIKHLILGSAKKLKYTYNGSQFSILIKIVNKKEIYHEPCI